MEEIHAFLLFEFVSLYVFMIRGLCLQYNISEIGYIFYNKHFAAFLEHQISKDKPTPWFTVEFWNLTLILCNNISSFSQ